MISSRVLRTFGFVGLLALAIPCVSGPTAASTARPEAQVRIAEVVKAITEANRGGRGDEIPTMADDLLRSTDGGRESLLLELVWFIADNPGNETAMATALLIDYYGFTDDEKIEALTPHLDTPDTRFRDATWEVFATIDQPRGVQESVQRVQQLERLLRQTESIPQSESEGARSELDELSRDEIWWIRLYAAAVARSHPDLGPDVAERLRADPDPRVRHAVGD